MARFGVLCLISASLVWNQNETAALRLHTRTNELDVGESTRSANAEIVGARVSAVQAELDSFCHNWFEKICKGGDNKFCNRSAVARFGKGSPSQQTDQWRCYAGEIVVPSGREVRCVDDCGHYFPCLGVIDSKKTFHSTAHQQILSLISSASERHCSAFQATADKYCNGIHPDSVARKDTGLVSQKEKEWRCYAKESLTYEASGICKDNCGGDRQCPGGRSETSGKAIKEHFTKTAELQKLFESEPKPCPTICIPTSTNRPVCADEDSLLQHTKRSKTQSFLDDACQEEFDRLCSSNKTFCDKTAVARKDRGRAGSQEKAEWRCYSLEELDLQERSSVCADDCGHELSCQGGVRGEQSIYHTTWKSLESKLSEGKSKFCSARQEAANEHCQKEFPDSLARFDYGAGEDNPGWICVKKEALRGDAESQCATDGEGTVVCGGGRSGIDGPLSVNDARRDDAGIEAAMKNVPQKCP